jgi:hypothetical protein
MSQILIQIGFDIYSGDRHLCQSLRPLSNGRKAAR